MAYLNSQAFAGRTTQLEFLDTTLSPSAYVQIDEVKTINFTGSKADLADVTNMQSGVFREWLPTLNDSGELAFTANYLPGDSTQTKLIGFFNAQTLVSWNVVLPNSLGIISFKGFVVGLDRDIPVDKEASMSGKIKITGAITLP